MKVWFKKKKIFSSTPADWTLFCRLQFVGGPKRGRERKEEKKEDENEGSNQVKGSGIL